MRGHIINYLVAWWRSTRRRRGQLRRNGDEQIRTFRPAHGVCRGCALFGLEDEFRHGNNIGLWSGVEGKNGKGSVSELDEQRVQWVAYSR